MYCTLDPRHDIWRMTKEGVPADSRVHSRARILLHLEHRVAPVHKVALILRMLLRMAGRLAACTADPTLMQAAAQS